MALKNLKNLTLSLQFGVFPDASGHRAALPRHSVARWLRHALQSDAEITVRIVGADEGRALNRDYRGKDYATNVLTFVYHEKKSALLMGDIVLCAPIVAREARAQGKTLEAHYAHLTTHGALHLAGMDHATLFMARAMEKKEVAILAALGFSNPYCQNDKADAF